LIILCILVNDTMILMPQNKILNQLHMSCTRLLHKTEVRIKSHEFKEQQMKEAISTP